MCSECPQIPIQIDLGEHGLYYGTSTAVKGLLVAGNSVEEVMAMIPKALAEMRAATGIDDVITKALESS